MADRIREIQKVFAPLPRAVRMAAEQNVLRDYRKGIVSATGLYELELTARLKYYNEARKLLKETGENYPPTYPDYKHICLKKEI